MATWMSEVATLEDGSGGPLGNKRQPKRIAYTVTVEWRRTSTWGHPKTWTATMDLTKTEADAFKRETFANDADVHSIRFTAAGTAASVKHVRGLKMDDVIGPRTGPKKN